MKIISKGIMMALLTLNQQAFSETNRETCKQSFIDRQWQQAQLDCESALLADKTEHKSLTVISYLAQIYAKLDDLDKEKLYLSFMNEHPSYAQDLQHQYYWNRRTGQLTYFETAYDDAENYFRQASIIADQLGDKALQSKSYNDLGILHSITGNYTRALEYYKKSVVLKLELNQYLSAANTFSNIGSLLLKLEKPEESIDYLLQAIDYYKKVDNVKMITHVHEELSMAYLKSGQDEKAQFYINKILASSPVRTTDEEQSNASLALAKYYFEEGKPEIAQILLNQAVYEDKPMYFIETSLELAKVELELKNNQKARNVALKALKVAEENNDVFYQFNLNSLLSKSLEEDFPKMALSYLKASQEAREIFLKKKYDSKIDTIEYQIKKHKFDKDLLVEKLANSEKQKRISTLTNWILMAFLFLLLTFMAWALYVYKKRKEKQVFLEQIKYHKDQLELLNAANKERDEDQKVTEVITKHDFKEALIKAMVEAVDIWNRHTGKNRIDLAEKSKVWTVTIDNGTLRTRSMDKYLSLKNIPANPRWRKVVRTCHFILSDSSLNSVDRNLLNENLNEVMRVIKAL